MSGPLIEPELSSTVTRVNRTPYGTLIWDGHLIAVEDDGGGWDWHVIHPPTCAARTIYPSLSDPGLSWIEYDCAFEQQLSAIGPEAFGEVDDAGWPEDIPRSEGLYAAGFLVERYVHHELGPEYDVFLTVCRHKIEPSCC